MAKERITFSTRRFLVGKAGPFPRLVFREDVMLRLDQFAHTRAKGEHGGFLIGRKRELKSAEQYEVLVERFVPIPQKDEATRLVITQEHLLTVQRALADADRGEEVVGWAHTHPGFGVFLSNFDKEQHERFFPHPWQVAYVMDNLAHERAAYHLDQGEWHRLEGYYVLREMAENEIAIDALSRIRWSRLAILALLIVFLIGAGSYGYGLLRQVITPPSPSSVSQVVPPPTTPEPTVTVQRKDSPPATAKPPENNQVASSTRPVPPPAQAPLYGEYVVQAGDNLWKIAGKLWGDPSLFKLLAEENGITNPSVIPVGKVLRVPQRPEIKE
jgi:proteasome lid subunit RPN8/RPN11/LysM repeat protein